MKKFALIIGLFTMLSVAIFMPSGECKPLEEAQADLEREINPPCMYTFEYNPACGNDDGTYSNPFNLDCAIDRLMFRGGEVLFMKHMGKCMNKFTNISKKEYYNTPEFKEELVCVCTMELNPVCGSESICIAMRC